MQPPLEACSGRTVCLFALASPLKSYPGIRLSLVCWLPQERSILTDLWYPKNTVCWMGIAGLGTDVAEQPFPCAVVIRGWTGRAHSPLAKFPLQTVWELLNVPCPHVMEQTDKGEHLALAGMLWEYDLVHYFFWCRRAWYLWLMLHSSWLWK